MNIRINDQYRVSNDEHQIIVYRSYPVSKDKAVSFHATINQALESLYQRMIRESDATTLAELRETIESAVATLSDAYTTVLAVDQHKNWAS